MPNITPVAIAACALGATLLAGAAQAAGPACPDQMWSGAKSIDLPAGWNPARDQLSSPNRVENGARVECRYTPINPTSYVWRADLDPANVTCPDFAWIGAQDAPPEWRETQSKIANPEKRVFASNRVECHYANQSYSYVWMNVTSACPAEIWSGAKSAPAGWKETQEKVSGPTERQVGANRTECHYNNSNPTVYIWRNDIAWAKAMCPESLWTGAKSSPAGWNETQTKVSPPTKRVNGARIECHYPKPATVYIWK